MSEGPWLHSHDAVWQAERAQKIRLLPDLKIGEPPARREPEAAKLVCELCSAGDHQRAAVFCCRCGGRLSLSPAARFQSRNALLQTHASELVNEIDGMVSSFQELEQELMGASAGKQPATRSAIRQPLRTSASETSLSAPLGTAAPRPRPYEGFFWEPKPHGRRGHRTGATGDSDAAATAGEAVNVLPSLRSSASVGRVRGLPPRRSHSRQQAAPGYASHASNRLPLRALPPLGSKAQRALRLGGRVRIEQGDGAAPVREQLMRLLQVNLLRVCDLFRRWDVDGDGCIRNDEFFEAVWALGYEAPREETDALFESFDGDGSGTIEYAELHEMLRAKQR